MVVDKPHINPYLFQRQLEAFKGFVEEQSGVAFVSFAANPYTEKQEGYKYEIHHAGRDALAFQAWKQSDIGSGDIAEAVIGAIEIPNSNLVPWQGRFGKEARPHQPLFDAKNQQDQLPRIEECLFKLYREEQDEKSFVELVAIFGKTYPLLAYLFFLKDRSRYLPIAPMFLDRAFEHLGANFKTSHRCSWDNYSIYVGLIGEIKAMLTETFFVSLGYTQDRWGTLRDDLLVLARSGDAVPGRLSVFGRMFEVGGMLTGPSGRTAEIRTVWIVASDEASPRFVTAYPR